MRCAKLVLSSVVLLAGLSGCVTLDAKLVEALAKDKASFCASVDTRGGAGGIVGGATGGYGQSTLSFCRSGMREAKVTLSPDGAISIEHGKQEADVE